MTTDNSLEGGIQALAVPIGDDSRLKLALDAALMGTWERDLLTGQDFWSERQEALFGLTPGSFGTTHRSFLEHVHPEDRPMIEEAARRAVEGRSRYESEYRIYWPDGSVRWMMGRGDVLRDSDGRATRMLGVTMDITERKLAELRLAAEHAVGQVLSRSSTLHEAAPRILESVCQTTGWQWGAMWAVDRHSNVLRCNETWQHPATNLSELGLESQAVTFGPGAGLPGRVWAGGQPVWITDISQDGNLSRSQAMLRAGLHGALAFPVMLENQVLAVMEFLSRDVRSPDHALLAMMQSIGAQLGQFIERRRADQQLRDSEARNTAIMEAALDCIITMDQDGKVIEWNNAAERTFGYQRAQAIGREMAELIIPPSMREAHRAGLARFLKTGLGAVIDTRIEITAIRSDGREFPVELAVTPVKTEGRATFTGYLRDITTRKEAEAERNRLLSAERDARHDAEKANRMKDEFLSIVSHELRTPLNAILGWSQILSGEKVNSDDLKEGLEVIQRNARVQTQIIEDILDMSRIISGKVRLDVQRVDLPSVIQAAIESMQPAAAAKGIRLQKVLDPVAGPVSGDPARLQQIVWNLISNAIKFTPRDGRVRVTLARVNSHVEISVSDTGQGINREFLPHVFERFRQADSGTTRRHGGLGLGLSIVKQLVELHGGTVHASSDGENLGSTFRVELPLTPIHASDDHGVVRQHPRSGVSDSPDCDPPTLTGLKVLVVDDEPDARALIRRLLEDCQAQVITAGSVDEAMRMILEKRPEVIVSDIGMPGKDGYELVRALRSLPEEKGGNTPAVALTAFARSEDRVRSMLAGFDLHIAKPVEPSELRAVIARLAGRVDHPQ